MDKQTKNPKAKHPFPLAASPFLTPSTLTQSEYLIPSKAGMRKKSGGAATLMQENIYHDLRSFVMQASYPCIAAAKAAAKHDLRLGVYGSFDATDTAQVLAYDLHQYIDEQRESDNTYLTFVAVFERPHGLSEARFEKLLWKQLQALHDLSDPHFTWDPRAKSEPQDPAFCFSFAGDSMFVVGLHDGSSRLSRRFKYPALVFNLYRQFEALKAAQQYAPMQHTNRKRDLVFQGSINPMLTRFGEEAEAIQFSGREHKTFWQCPFQKSRETESS